MHKSNRPISDPHIFTFTNSVKNSQTVTPETSKYCPSYSSNVSFLNGISASIKSFYTEPYSIMKDSHFPQLFSNNKEN